MKAATKELDDKLNRDIDETLCRWKSGEDIPGDGFNIIRWARKGWLVRSPTDGG